MEFLFRLVSMFARAFLGHVGLWTSISACPHYPPFNAESMLPFFLVKTQDSRLERIEVPTIANTSAVDHSRVQ
ncbi:hypothetical protein BCON_0041g00520 [Botryotinia convoluta]|uniref:Secreted protein n=1 Tax=Botryotinia convoluta TaxID=54673 RepID=A0A4Z1IT05_9HELO|nr:hypothetical protein BCON_0041g00520 [Botryotinia convoluta]